MRRNIDAWIPYLDRGVDTIVVNASGCTAMLKDYGKVLAHDKQYALAAQRITDASRDLSEVVEGLLPKLLPRVTPAASRRIAFHPPCTLQHGVQIRGVVESLMTAAGFEIRVPRDSHLCCGSAGTYSLLQPVIADQLRADKLKKLSEIKAECIVSANIGCISHLQAKSSTPVRHWIEPGRRIADRRRLMLFGLTVLLVFQLVGEALTYAFSLPIPGPVIGMLLLFGYLQWRGASAELRRLHNCCCSTCRYCSCLPELVSSVTVPCFAPSGYRSL